MPSTGRAPPHGLRRRAACAAILAGAGAVVTGTLPACAAARPAGTVEFWTLALRPFEGYLRERFAAFEAARPGVRVQWVDVPFDALDRKLVSAASAGRAPDLVNFSDKTFARFASLGATVDLDPLLPADAASRYVPGAFRLGRLGGGLRALPWYLTTQTVLCNRALLARGGLLPEHLAATWSALLPQARQFSREAGLPLFSVPLGTESDLLQILFAEGLQPLQPGPGGRLKSALASPPIATCLAAWVEAFHAGAIPREAVTGGSAHLADLYQNSRVALINSGPNFLKRIRVAAPGVFDATDVRPPITGSLGRAHIAVMTLCVTSQSREPRLAADLAWHMTSPESQEALCRLATILPSSAASLAGPLFAAPNRGRPDAPADAPADADGKIARAQAVTARALGEAVAFTPALAVWPDMRRAFEDRIKRVLLDGSPLQPALERIDAEWNSLLASAAWAPADALPPATPLVLPAGPGSGA